MPRRLISDLQGTNMDSATIELIAKVLAPAISAIVLAAVKHYGEKRTKLVTYLVHASAISLRKVDPEDAEEKYVHQHSIVVANAGQKAANNVRISHNVKDMPDFSIFPQVQYTMEKNPQGYTEIVIPVLVPKEQVTISYLYFPPVLFHQVSGMVKSDDGFAKFLDIIPKPRPNRYLVGTSWVLMFIGGTSVAYWTIQLLWRWIKFSGGFGM